MRYPDARRLDLVEEIHGHRVADPYRWLEDAGSDGTQAWCATQDVLCRGYLDGLPGRERLRTRLRELLPGFVGPPAVWGDRMFFSRRLPEQEHPTYLVREPDGTERVLVDPMEIDPSGLTTLEAATPSKDGRLLAYQTSEAGTEESVLRVLDVDTGDVVDGPIEMGRTGGVEWLPGGEAFYYVRRLPDSDIPEGEHHFHRRVWLHRVGANPSDDVVVFGEGRDKRTYYGLHVSLDGRWLVVGCSIGTEPRNDVYLAALEAADPGRPAFLAIQEGVDAQTWASVRSDGRLYLFTNRDAPRWRLVVADPVRPEPRHWRDLVPETDAVLRDWALTEDAVVVVHERDVVAEASVVDKETGEPRAKVDLPGLGSATLTTRPDGGDDVWIGYTDHLTPYTVLHYSVSGGAVSTWAEAPGAPDTRAIRARQVFYRSKDGTRIPMFVLARDDAEPGSPRPTVLSGYGGFNVPLEPAYSAGIVTWVGAGGVYAIANLRGGSEYGEEWHRAGMRQHKQNVFDDFLAAAEWLVGEGWTSPERLGVSGGSNGGLLVGAALTQRPDRFRAVVCSAPLLDMVRYERFGLGSTWNDEYGTADDATEFGWLISYSPYHHVEEGTEYPAVLFCCFESDTRTDPLHARKMCAALQWATACDPAERPVLIRRETDVGHAARAISRAIDLSTDTLAFLAAQLGLDLG